MGAFLLYYSYTIFHMNWFKKALHYFSIFEWILMFVSIIAIVLAFIIFHNEQYVYLITSILGVINLAFLAKGNPIGMFLTLIFSLLYAFISYNAQYYGEMITYLGMTGLISAISLISWLRHPSKHSKAEVEVNNLKPLEYGLALLLALAVTTGFFFLLRWLNTSNLIVSTISIFTSFYASYLALRRSKFYALAYVLNDIVLIVLWSMATVNDLSYLAITICFGTFLIYDFYSFINWGNIEKRQKIEK